MEWKYTVAVMLLLISLVYFAGCTGPSSAPVATPAPVPAVTVISTPAPAGTAASGTPAYTWTTETPYAGHPYTKTYSFHGTGDYEDFTFSTDRDATWVFSLTYPKEGIFTVILKNARGEKLQVLANEGGAGTSRKTVSLKAGDYYFDIKADAPWYITMSAG
jgi:hypothetical protein